MTKIKASPYICITLDETFDISKTEQMAIYMTYLCGMTEKRVISSFVKIIPLENTQGSTIFDAVRKGVEYYNLDFRKIVFCGSDGASNMTGNNIGVLSYLRFRNPFILHNHCMNHRLALTTSDIKIDVLYLQQYIDILVDLHGFFAKSGLRNTTLKFYQFEENEPELAI